MEVLYAKLYKNYLKLKKEKNDEMDKLNYEQEVKFLNFAAAADEMVQHLKSANAKLNGQVDELKSKLYSRDEEDNHYKTLWMEGEQKINELSEEIARLQKVEHNQHPPDETGRRQEKSHDAPTEQETSGTLVGNSTKERRSLCTTTEGTTTPLVNMELDLIAAQNIQQPPCCQKKIFSSDDDVTDASSVDCIFHCLVEFMVGMKVSPLPQSDEPCIVAHHQSSGYSFSLTWVRASCGEVELLYRVVSLGSLESVAPEWMKETIMFGPTMCAIFFERVNRVINGQ